MIVAEYYVTDKGIAYYRDKYLNVYRRDEFGVVVFCYNEADPQRKVLNTPASNVVLVDR